MEQKLGRVSLNIEVGGLIPEHSRNFFHGSFLHLCFLFNFAVFSLVFAKFSFTLLFFLTIIMIVEGTTKVNKLGTTHHVPIALFDNTKLFLALRWLKLQAREKSVRTKMYQSLAGECG